MSTVDGSSNETSSNSKQPSRVPSRVPSRSSSISKLESGTGIDTSSISLQQSNATASVPTSVPSITAPPILKNTASVQVALRLKPITSSTQSQSSLLNGVSITHSVKDATVDIKLRQRLRDAGNVNNNVTDFSFSINAVLPPTTSQQEVFDTCVKDIVDGALDGVSGCVLAYGQTGAGKTYTMSGPPAGSFSDRGIMPRSISYIFSKIEEARQASGGEDRYSAIRVSYVEIYQDKLIDLLAKSPGDLSLFTASASGVESGTSLSQTQSTSFVSTPLSAAAESKAAGFLQVQEDKRGRIFVPGLSSPIVRSEAEAVNWLFIGQANRAIAEHALNKASTRSHCIFTVYLEQTMSADEATGVNGAAKAANTVTVPKLKPNIRGGNNATSVESSSQQPVDVSPPQTQRIVTVRSKLHLVDLAGSERLEKTASEGLVLREAQAINKSLAFLEQVVVALLEKGRDHVPYRQSKLTHMLKDALGGHCRTRMIAAAWSDADHVDETLSTLRFAARMMRVKTTPSRDIAASEGMLSEAERARIVSVYEAELTALRTELAMHDIMASILNNSQTTSNANGVLSPKRGNKSSDDTRDDTTNIINTGQDIVTSESSLSSINLGRQYSGIRYGPISVMEAEAIRGIVDRFISGDIENIEVNTFRQLTFAMHYLRDLVRDTRNKDHDGSESQFRIQGRGQMSSSSPRMTRAVLPILLSPLQNQQSSDIKSLSTGGDEIEENNGPQPIYLEQQRSSSILESVSDNVTNLSGSRQPIDVSTYNDPTLRAKALDNWRTEPGPGAAGYTDYQLAKASLRTKRADYGATASLLNETKRKIDTLASLQDDLQASELSSAKATYRQQFEALGLAKTEVEYLQRVVDSLATQLATEFGIFWAKENGVTPQQERGGLVETETRSNNGSTIGGGGGAGSVAAEAAYRASMMKTQLTVAQASQKRTGGAKSPMQKR
jgi:hypothetical protein